MYAEAFGREPAGSVARAKLVDLTFNAVVLLAGTTTIDDVDYKSCLDDLKKKIHLALRSWAAAIKSNCSQCCVHQQRIGTRSALIFEELNEGACLISWNTSMSAQKRCTSCYVRGGPPL